MSSMTYLDEAEVMGGWFFLRHVKSHQVKWGTNLSKPAKQTSQIDLKMTSEKKQSTKQALEQ